MVFNRTVVNSEAPRSNVTVVNNTGINQVLTCKSNNYSGSTNAVSVPANSTRTATPLIGFWYLYSGSDDVVVSGGSIGNNTLFGNIVKYIYIAEPVVTITIN